MKLWNLLGLSVAKSYCQKVIKKTRYSKADFDEIVRKALLKILPTIKLINIYQMNKLIERWAFLLFKMV